MTTFRERRSGRRSDRVISESLVSQAASRGWHWIYEGMTVAQATAAFKKRNEGRKTFVRPANPNSNSSRAFRGESPVCLTGVRNGCLDGSPEIDGLVAGECYFLEYSGINPMIALRADKPHGGTYQILCGGKDPDKTMSTILDRYKIQITQW